MKPNPVIVCIEDDEDIRESIKDALEIEGHRVITFRNGKEALEGLNKGVDAGLILLDLMMPVMDGWQFLEARQNASDSIKRIPVYILSAVAEQEKGKTMGASGYLKKPVDLDQLLILAKRYCD